MLKSTILRPWGEWNHCHVYSSNMFIKQYNLTHVMSFNLPVWLCLIMKEPKQFTLELVTSHILWTYISFLNAMCIFKKNWSRTLGNALTLHIYSILVKTHNFLSAVNQISIQKRNPLLAEMLCKYHIYMFNQLIQVYLYLHVFPMQFTAIIQYNNCEHVNEEVHYILFTMLFHLLSNGMYIYWYHHL